jgi:hypothetical protein
MTTTALTATATTTPDTDTTTTRTTTTAIIRDDSPVLYINIVLNDCSQAVHNKVKQKVGDKLPEPLAEGAAKIASKKVKPSKVAQKMGPKLCQKIPKKMATKGIDVVMEQVFVEKQYLVLQIQVQHVDAVLLEQAQREENADLTCNDSDNTERGIIAMLLEWGLYLMGAQYQHTLQTQVLPPKIMNVMKFKIKEIMDQKFNQKGLEADVMILQETEQARYFFGQLKELRQQRQRRPEGDDGQSSRRRGPRRVRQLIGRLNNYGDGGGGEGEEKDNNDDSLYSSDSDSSDEF